MSTGLVRDPYLCTDYADGSIGDEILCLEALLCVFSMEVMPFVLGEDLLDLIDLGCPRAFSSLA